VLRDDATGAEAELPRVARFYLAKGSRKRIVLHLEGGKQTTPPQATGIELAMDIPPGPLPEDLDRSRYIQAARKLIQAVGGFRHRDPDLLEDHALALEVFDAGLCPVPKWDGKAQMPGSDARRPTFLWDWSRVATVGTYTGPAVGILAVDIDDASLWSRGVSKGNLPLLGDRFASLAGCLVSCHGEATAGGVRAGTARGKLIFRVAGLGPDHPIARMGVSRWRKRYGVDVFYGRGMPSVLGRYSDDDAYRLEGTLSDAPGWLIEMLTPAPSKARRKTPAAAPADGPGDLEALKAELAAMEPKLEPSAWLEKDLGERVILTAPCPFEHESGRNGSADLSAGFHDDGPYIHCMHGTCEGSRRVNDRLRGRVSPGPTRITRPEIGDLIQWTSGGVDQFPEPKRVRDLSTCGGFVFVDGSTTGIPIGEVAAIKPSSSAMPDSSGGEGCGDDGPVESEISADGAPNPPPKAATKSKGKGGKAGSDAREQESQADRIIRLAGAVAWFHDASGRSYGAVPIEGRVEVHPVGSIGMKRWLRHVYFEQCGRTPSADAMREALEHFDSFAIYRGREEETYVRVAARDGAIFVDLGDPRRQAVRVDASGWRLIKDPPVRFRRPESLRPLPEPARDRGGLEALRALVNLDDDDYLLAVAWLAATMRTDGTYPVAVLIGEQGTAKTSMGRLLKGLVDPSGAPLRSEPREERDLVIAANNCHIVALDNITAVPGWLSDALARLSCGGGLSKRKNYTDDEEAIFEVKRPILLTGITDFVTRPDLLDRAVFLRLRMIPEAKRLTEKDYREKVEEARPRILGGLFDAIAGALGRLPAVEEDTRSLPRMADFALFAEALSRAIGREPGAFLKVYQANRHDANETLLDGNLLADVVRELARQGEWKGTAAQLLERLNAIAGERAKSKYWPKDATRLSGSLRRLAVSLRTVGVDVRSTRNTRDKSRTRLLSIEPLSRNVPQDSVRSVRDPDGPDGQSSKPF
jgi:hypothetical protein